jgi:PST family polysaccharide transporter
MAVGFYEKAGRMMLLPVRQVNIPLAAVLIPALSRVAADPPRLARFYLRAVELLLGVTIPMVFGLSLFAREVVHLWLGEQWADSAQLFRLLTVAAIMAVMISPMSWLLIALGQTRKYKWIGITTCSAHILSFIAGLPFGPRGVAIAYSISHVVLFFPVWIWAVRGTPMTLRAVLGALSPCLIACIPAGLAAYGLLHAEFLPWSHGVRTMVSAVGYGVVYAVVLLGWFRRWAIYTEVIQELKAARQRKEAAA